jgi:hypothetical protein
LLALAFTAGCVGVHGAPPPPTGAAGGSGTGFTPLGTAGHAGGAAGAAGGVAPDAGSDVDGGVVYQPPPPSDNCGARCYWGATGTPPANPNAVFGGAPAAASQAPGIVYPLAGSMHAINMLQMTFQWQRASTTQTLFRLRVAGLSTWDFFAGCTAPPPSAAPPSANQCVFTMPTGSWGALAYENRGLSASVSIAATDGLGGPVATSPAMTLAFSPDAVEGALYYWSTSLMGTLRAPFGAASATPFISPQTPANRLPCGGCHAVSRGGDVIAFAATPGASDSADGILTVAPTLTPAQPTIAPPNPAQPQSHNASLIALSPAGDRALVSANGGRLSLWNTQTGVKLSDIDPAVLGGLGATYPDWSADGQSIVLTLTPLTDFHADWAVTSGAIAVVPYNSGALGTPRVVVPSNGVDINAEPSFSPDGAWILFVSAPPAGAYGDNSQNPRTTLRLVSSQGGQIYDLSNATQQDQRLLGAAATPAAGAYSTWPKFAPYVQGAGNLMFFTFHSRIDYGWVLPNHLDDGRPQLWFAAIDLGRLAGAGGASVDPSYAPVWLPLQDVTQANHLGFWTQKIGCGSSGDCGVDQTCRAGRCQVVVHIN